MSEAKWGPRIGELTYMGAGSAFLHPWNSVEFCLFRMVSSAGSRVTPPLAMRLARAFAAGHLLRKGQMHLEDWNFTYFHILAALFLYKVPRTCELLWMVLGSFCFGASGRPNK